jgi:FAD/FMN-containing dehydrogenase
MTNDTSTLAPPQSTTTAPAAPAARPAGPAALAELAAIVTGEIVTPFDPGWDEARQAWNLAADRYPTLVAIPAEVADVVTVVEFARRHGLRVAPQGTGHNASTAMSLEGSILVSTHRLRGVDVDRETRVARVQAGTLAAELSAAAADAGLFPLSGSSPDVGVVGYTLGGGVSWLARRHGLAANHVTAIELVTPAGALVRATATDHPELFWALRGGSGNFGVVTALEIELLPVREVYAGMFLWPVERLSEVLETWYELTRHAPDELTTSFRVLHMPPLEELPPFLRGRSVVVIDGAFAGPPDDRAAVLARLRTMRVLRELAPEMDTWRPTSPVELSHMHMDPEQPTPFVSDAMLLADLDAGARDAFATALQPGTPLLIGEIRHIGGALARAPENGGALGALPGEFMTFGVGILPGPDAVAPVEAGLRDLRHALRHVDTGRAYTNFAERPVDPATLFGSAAYQRLRELRATVDPGGIMVPNHPIPPLT